MYNVLQHLSLVCFSMCLVLILLDQTMINVVFQRHMSWRQIRPSNLVCMQNNEFKFIYAELIGTPQWCKSKAMSIALSGTHS